MKQSQSPIWQKKRKRKFKKAKNTQQSVQPKKVPQVPIKKGSQSPNETPQVKKASFTSIFFSKIINSKKTGLKLSQKKEGSIKGFLIRHDSDIQLILFPLILLVILLILYSYNSRFALSLSNQSPGSDNQLLKLHPYPYVEAVAAPIISAQTAIILDRDSQIILYSKNPQLRFSLASTTKIMTALIALNYYKPEDILTIKRSYVEGSGLNLYSGEHFTFINLLYAMLLPSANDAAQAIADNYPGGEDAFVSQMNQKAQSLHLTNTHYADPIGLDDDGDYSTVVDMAHLATYAITNPTFAEVTSTKYKTITNTSFTRQYPLKNSNDLLGIDGVTGIKTGTTEGAKEVLVTSVVKNGHTYIIIVMDSNDRFTDTRTLINFVSQNVKYVVPPGM